MSDGSKTVEFGRESDIPCSSCGCQYEVVRRETEAPKPMTLGAVLGRGPTVEYRWCQDCGDDTKP
jgi:hypothetical protein